MRAAFTLPLPSSPSSSDRGHAARLRSLSPAKATSNSAMLQRAGSPSKSPRKSVRYSEAYSPAIAASSDEAKVVKTTVNNNDMTADSRSSAEAGRDMSEVAVTAEADASIHSWTAYILDDSLFIDSNVDARSDDIVGYQAATEHTEDLLADHMLRADGLTAQVEASNAAISELLAQPLRLEAPQSAPATVQTAFDVNSRVGDVSECSIDASGSVWLHAEATHMEHDNTRFADELHEADADASFSSSSSCSEDARLLEESLIRAAHRPADVSADMSIDDSVISSRLDKRTIRLNPTNRPRPSSPRKSVLPAYLTKGILNHPRFGATKAKAPRVSIGDTTLEMAWQGMDMAIRGVPPSPVKRNETRVEADLQSPTNVAAQQAHASDFAQAAAYTIDEAADVVMKGIDEVTRGVSPPSDCYPLDVLLMSSDAPSRESSAEIDEIDALPAAARAELLSVPASPENVQVETCKNDVETEPGVVHVPELVPAEATPAAEPNALDGVFESPVRLAASIPLPMSTGSGYSPIKLDTAYNDADQSSPNMHDSIEALEVAAECATMDTVEDADMEPSDEQATDLETTRHSDFDTRHPSIISTAELPEHVTQICQSPSPTKLAASIALPLSPSPAKPLPRTSLGHQNIFASSPTSLAAAVPLPASVSPKKSFRRSPTSLAAAMPLPASVSPQKRARCSPTSLAAAVALPASVSPQKRARSPMMAEVHAALTVETESAQAVKCETPSAAVRTDFDSPSSPRRSKRTEGAIMDAPTAKRKMPMRSTQRGVKSQLANVSSMSDISVDTPTLPVLVSEVQTKLDMQLAAPDAQAALQRTSDCTEAAATGAEPECTPPEAVALASPTTARRSSRRIATTSALPQPKTRGAKATKAPVTAASNVAAVEPEVATSEETKPPPPIRSTRSARPNRSATTAVQPAELLRSPSRAVRGKRKPSGTDTDEADVKPLRSAGRAYTQSASNKTAPASPRRILLSPSRPGGKLPVSVPARAAATTYNWAEAAIDRHARTFTAEHDSPGALKQQASRVFGEHSSKVPDGSLMSNGPIPVSASPIKALQQRIGGPASPSLLGLAIAPEALVLRARPAEEAKPVPSAAELRTSLPPPSNTPVMSSTRRAQSAQPIDPARRPLPIARRSKSPYSLAGSASGSTQTPSVQAKTELSGDMPSPLAEASISANVVRPPSALGQSSQPVRSQRSARPNRAKAVEKPAVKVAKPLTVAQLTAVTLANTEVNQRPYNKLEVTTIHKDENRPPSPTAKIRKMSGDTAEQPKFAAAKSSTRAAPGVGVAAAVAKPSVDKTGKRPHFLAAGDDDTFESPVKRGRIADSDGETSQEVRTVKWDRDLLKPSPPDIKTPRRARTMSRHAAMRQLNGLPSLDDFGNVRDCKASLSPALPRCEVAVSRIIYKDDPRD